MIATFEKTGQLLTFYALITTKGTRMSKELAQEERYCIYAGLRNGFSVSQIAKNIKRHKSTIYRELKRNTGKRGYRPKQAHTKAFNRRQAAQKNKRLSPRMKRHIEWYLKYGLSPEQIVGRFRYKKRECVSIEWIYQYIWKDKKQGGKLYTYLRRKNRKNQKRGRLNDNRGIIPNRRSINSRPKIVEERTRIGDWEIDLVAGKKRSGYLVTATERRINMTRIGFVKSKDSIEVENEVIRILSKDKFLYTITSDNGKEFSNHERIAKRLEIDYYFANPYSSWERGTNENTNGLIRQYFPKKEYFKENEEFTNRISSVEKLLNNRPRKKINFKTPNEIYFEELVAIAS